MRRLGVLALAAVLVAGCTAQTPTTAPSPATSAPSSVPVPSSAAPSPSTSATPTSKPKPKPHPVSVQALIDKSYDGRDLKLGRSLGTAGDYASRRVVTYRSDGLTVSGVLFRPRGRGPFPVVVLNHGYIDPDTYFPGQGMPREQTYLAERGYAVLHVDYRGHASGDEHDGNVDYELRLPYAVDTINAVLAVKESGIDWLDGDRVAWMGRSMGGNVTLNALVAQPGLVDAAVIYASTSSLAAENFNTFYRDNADRRGTVRRIDRTYGLPEDAPGFWRRASPRYAFDRVTEPLLVHHGEQDDTCPVAWSEDIVDTLEDEGKEVRFYRYDGEGHTFEGQWARSMRRSVDFLDDHLR